MDFARNPPIPVYIGSMSAFRSASLIANQGEKLKTQLDITHNERLRDANVAQVFSDVDSAYATLDSNLNLLRPYKASYLQEAVRGPRYGFLRHISMAERPCSTSCKHNRTTAALN